ncbi:unnamed protein product [Brassica oleracea]
MSNHELRTPAKRPERRLTKPKKRRLLSFDLLFSLSNPLISSPLSNSPLSSRTPVMSRRLLTPPDPTALLRSSWISLTPRSEL